jgi:hypothetical protein
LKTKRSTRRNTARDPTAAPAKTGGPQTVRHTRDAVTHEVAMKRVRTKTLQELERKYFTPDEVAEVKKAVEAEILEMNLRELRQLVGKTQEEVATATHMRQPELSRVERREDHLLSTLRAYVEALGGDLEIIARFDGKTVRLRGV